MPIASDGKGNYLTLGSDGQWSPATRARNPETGAELVLDGADWKPLPTPQAAAPRGNEGGMVDSIARTFANGATFGFADEIAAGGDALLGHLAGRGSQAGSIGQRYDENLAKERGRDAAFQQENPVTAFAGNVAGGMMGPGRGLGLIKKGVSEGSGMLARALLSAPGRGAVAGATGGALGGFGEGEGGFGERMAAALTGGSIGAGGGAALAAGANAAAGFGGRLTHALGLRNPEVAADRQVLRALDRDGRAPEEIAARLRPEGVPSVPAAPNAPGTVMADVGGRNVVNLTATAANTPGDAMELADRVVQSRRAARPERIAEASDEAFGGGSGGDVAGAREGLLAQRATEAAPLYAKAFSQPAGFTPEMQGVLNDPVTRAGLARGLEIQRIENTTARARGQEAPNVPDSAIRIGDDGVPEVVSTPNMRSLDAVKRGLDAIIEDARDGTTGKVQWTERLRAIDSLRHTWVGMLDQANPDYAAARAAWAGPSQAMDAITRGEGAFRANRDAVATGMRRTAEDNLPFAQLGAGRALTDMASDPQKAVGAARRMTEDRQMQSRLASVLPDPAARAGLQGALGREVQMGEVDKAISPRAGSQTARLSAGGDDMGRDAPGPWAAALLQAASGRPVEAMRTAGSDLLRRGQGINPATASALAQRLLETDPQKQGEMMARLMGRRDTDAARQKINEAIAARLLQSIGVAGGIAAN